MTELHLILGNKNYSSWSVRAWLAMREAAIPFRETTIWLDTATARDDKLAHSPAGRVPILRHGELTVWDSLAICEYVAESFPDRGIWPTERTDRARARSLCAEMHSGFAGLRTFFPMNCRRTTPRSSPLPDAVRDDLTRLEAIFAAATGPFLVGDHCLADVFFAPIVSRLASYGVQLDNPRARSYAEAVAARTAYREWHAIAAAEGHPLLPYDRLD